MLHDVAVRLFWPGADPLGAHEYRDRRLLGSAAARPFQTAGLRPIHRSTTRKAAALFHSLISNNPFYNGNKRTAVIALDHFLLANRYYLLLSNDEMYRLAEETAAYRVRGTGHEEELARLAQIMRQSAAPFQKVKGQLAVADYQELLQARRVIRKHALNRQPHRENPQ